MTTNFAPEFSRLVSISDIKTAEMRLNVTASRLECGALAERFSLEDLESLEAQLIFSNSSSGGVLELDASFIADIIQICIVTLRPIKKHLDGEFHCTIVKEDTIDKDPVEVFEFEDVDPAEVCINGSFDVGELVSQQLSLEIDPFPRAEGVVFQHEHSSCSEQEMGRENPFKILKGLHNKEN